MNKFQPVLKKVIVKCVYCGREREIMTMHEEDVREVNKTCPFDSMPMIEKSKVKIIWKNVQVD